MPSVTTWFRLESRCRSDALDEGLAGPVRDPLWFLTRQWQLGELRGQDAGSPVTARIRTESAQLTRYAAGVGAPSSAYDVNARPLEVTVEREVVRDAAAGDRGLAIEAGQHFLRLLDAAGAASARPSVLAAYPLASPTAAERASLDADTLRRLDLMAGRVPDGAALFAAGATPPIAASSSAVAGAVAAFRAWWSGLFTEPEAAGASWIPWRMEYSFAVSARNSDGEVVLSSGEYVDGRLDWDDFDHAPGATLGATAAPTQAAQTVVPSQVRFRGMPGHRVWEFEDSEVDLGNVPAGPLDLARMIVLEFALIYGNEWYLIPVDAQVGSLTRVRSLVVTDTFGERTLVQAAPDTGDFRLFSIGDMPGLLLAPTLVSSLAAEPFEQVSLLRDEMADLAWALEESVASPIGRRLDRRADWLSRQPSAPAPPPSTSAPPRWTLAQQPPDYWFPLVPTVPATGGRRLVQGELLPTSGAAPSGPRGRILAPTTPLQIYDSDVPREGARVRRGFKRTRWINGTTHVWLGRVKSPGRGEGSSGLAYDRID